MKTNLRHILVVLVALVAPALAQPLADRVPGDAIVYAAWSGAEGLPPAYAQSHLKALLESSKIRELFSEFLPQVMSKVSGGDNNARQSMQVARMLMTQVWNHPTAVYFAGLDMNNPQQPIPRIGIICRAGADAAGIQNWLGPLLAQLPPDAPMRSAVVQDMLVVTIGYADATQGVAATNTLKQSETFASVMRQAQADPVCVTYVDFEKLLSMIEKMIPPQMAARDRAMFDKVLEASGVRGLKRVICTSGFDGKDWMDQMFIDAPAPRTGLLEMLDAKPVSADLLKSIPADATFAATWRFDGAKLLTRIRDIAGQADPRAQQIFDQGIGIAQMALARNLITDLLEPLGDDWAAYCSPAVAGNGILGMAIVNHLDDPAKANTSLAIGWVNASNWVNALLRQQHAPIEIVGRTVDIGGMNVNYLGVPMVAPAWTVKNGNLYMGLYPQTVASAARWAERGEKSIADSPKFIALQKRLGVSNPTGFSFYDLPETATQGGSYQQLMLVARYAGFGDVFGIPLPEPLVPPLDVLRQHLAVAGSAGWVDNAGYHVKSISPFPGAKVLSEPGLMMTAGGPGMTAIMASVMLPSLNRARETANRVKCAANLKAMGQALLLYANDHQGKYPAKLSGLLEIELTLEVFVCPSGSTEIPLNVRTGNKQVQADWIDQHSDYVYLGAGKTSNEGADTILIHEKAEDHARSGMNMLYGDGHVDWNMLPTAMQEIEKQTKAAGR